MIGHEGMQRPVSSMISCPVFVADSTQLDG